MKKQASIAMLTLTAAVIATACGTTSTDKQEDTVQEDTSIETTRLLDNTIEEPDTINYAAYGIEFPYQEFIEAKGRENLPYICGDNGRNPISHKTRYVTLNNDKAQGLVDSLATLYNAILAFNAVAYDMSNISRNFEDWEKEPYIKGLGNINLVAIGDSKLKTALKRVCSDAAGLLKNNDDPTEMAIPSVDAYFNLLKHYETDLLLHRPNKQEIDMTDLIPEYKEIQVNPLVKRTGSIRKIIELTLGEQDFHKKCAYASLLVDYAYYDVDGPGSLVGIIDPLLKSGEYSPLLRKLWLDWRYMLQCFMLGGLSKDSEMYNLFYNDMRNTVAATYLHHLQEHPDDALALKEFIRLAHEDNVMHGKPFSRNNCMYGILDLL